jgi:exopolysaccharide biosynthesis protein
VIFCVKWLPFLLFLLNPLCAYPEWNTMERQNSPVPGAILKASALRITDGGNEANISFVYFTAGDVVLETVPNLDGQLGGLSEIAQSKQALAGINGGYFDNGLSPIGLLISNDRVVHGLQRAKILSGIFYVKAGRPALARTREFPGVKGVQQAIQCGPFLVDGGSPVLGLDQGRVAARTFIFSCNSSLWGFGICRSVTLEQMGRILTEIPLVPNHPISRALNLDGGSSTTFYVKTGNGTIFSQGRPIVSNYLIAKPKD